MTLEELHELNAELLTELSEIKQKLFAAGNELTCERLRHISTRFQSPVLLRLALAGIPEGQTAQVDVQKIVETVR